MSEDLREVSRRRLMAFAAVGVAAAPVLGAGRAAAAATKPELMFVQVAEGIKVDPAAKTFTLVGVNPQTIYFADRPERLAGHVKMSAFLEEWTSKAGADNFGKDPPNAALSTFEPGQTNNTLAIVEISKPRVSGRDLTYSYTLIRGTLPKATGETTLFIDWIGVGGGVGPGFHGVGVGARGPGIY